jgi:hypothetical protein
MFSIIMVVATAWLQAVMTPLRTETLTRESSVVLRGEVAAVTSHWSSDRSVIFTRAAVRIYNVIRGQMAGTTVVVEYPGGKVGEMGMGISDQPQMRVGEQVLLFLKPGKSFGKWNGQVYRIVGAGQGKYSIGEDGIARKGGFSVIDFEKNEMDSQPMKGKVKNQPAFKDVEKIIDNDIPVDVLIKKICGEEPEEPLPGFVISAVNSESGISRPMYSTHGHLGNWYVHLKLNTSGGPSYGLGAILAGMNEWNGVYPSAFKWIYAGTTTSKSSSRNGVNIVYFTGLSGNLLGYSSWWYSGGHIIETDVKLRSNYSWNFLTLKAVVMHELGHSLGLNHVTNNSIMKVPITDARQWLFSDDINAVTDLYPSFNSCGNFNGQDADTKYKADILLRRKDTGDVAVWLLDGTSLSNAGKAGTAALSWHMKGLGDFNNDGKTDIVWWHSSTAKVAVWLMDGISISSSGVPGTASLTWQIRGLADFNGDGNTDILLRHSTSGDVAVWLMNGASLSSSGVPGTALLDWQIKGVGDFDADGKADILLRNGKNGNVAVWLLDGTTLTSSGVIAAVTHDWHVLGLGDVNADSKADILWRNGTNGDVAVWLINGTSLSGSGKPGNASTDWMFSGTGDFNGDGKVDILWRNSGSGKVAVWLMDGTALSSSGVPGTASFSWKIKGLGDFNDDSKTDILLRNTANGDVAAWLMNGTSLLSTGKPGNAALAWKIN